MTVSLSPGVMNTSHGENNKKNIYFYKYCIELPYLHFYPKVLSFHFLLLISIFENMRVLFIFYIIFGFVNKF